MTMRPFAAALLSALAPGLGQWVNGKRTKAAALLCLTLGFWGFMALATWGPKGFRSSFSLVMLQAAYLCVAIPAMLEAYRGDPDTATSIGDRRWYVIAMVCTLGVMSLPLIWHNRRFSRTAKMAWSAVGILNTLLAFALALAIGPALDQSLNELRSLGGLP